MSFVGNLTNNLGFVINNKTFKGRYACSAACKVDAQDFQEVGSYIAGRDSNGKLMGFEVGDQFIKDLARPWTNWDFFMVENFLRVMTLPPVGFGGVVRANIRILPIRYIPIHLVGRTFAQTAPQAHKSDL
ncbi:MAG: hypothetical protein CMH56_06435 [Myxococcales bacterium]|nr:hypothetical protein [Myxococcales bacterium]